MRLRKPVTIPENLNRIAILKAGCVPAHPIVSTAALAAGSLTE